MGIKSEPRHTLVHHRSATNILSFSPKKSILVYKALPNSPKRSRSEGITLHDVRIRGLKPCSQRDNSIMLEAEQLPVE